MSLEKDSFENQKLTLRHWSSHQPHGLAGLIYLPIPQEIKLCQHVFVKERDNKRKPWTAQMCGFANSSSSSPARGGHRWCRPVAGTVHWEQIAAPLHNTIIPLEIQSVKSKAFTCTLTPAMNSSSQRARTCNFATCSASCFGKRQTSFL